ncbi:MAG: DHH family phosphoesterase [Bacteroidales bacterium]|nr:DHH family phosphoesterase [Bacteroidales bacterium]
MKRKDMDLKTAIRQADHIVIVGHYNPDGDAVGSTMGLKYLLANMGKAAEVIYPNAYAQNLKWMDPAGSAVIYNERTEKGNALIARADLIFCLDFQALGRTDAMAQPLTESKAFKVLIDHHIGPALNEFDLCFSETAVSSTCEKLYKTVAAELDAALVDKCVASCLYAGICTDTGSFSYACRHAGLFHIVAALIERGADTVRIHRAIFDTFSASRMYLLGYCLHRKLVVMPAYGTAYISLNIEEMEQFHYQAGDLEGVVNYALSIEGVSFAAFFTQRKNRIRISLRSKGEVDVNEFARQHFNGGGHKNAAGGSSFEGLAETLARFERLVPEFYEKEIKPKRTALAEIPLI